MKPYKPYLILVLTIAGLFLSGIEVFPQQTADQLYEKALYLEEAKGELQGAIDLYSKIVENRNADQSFQAKALLHIGMCYEKLGMKEATKAYQRLVSNFPAQKNEVAIARERLSKLITTESSKEIVIRQVWTGKDVDDFGSVSADGEYLTFTDWGTGNLAIRNLNTGQNKSLTREGSWNSPEQYAEFSLISPNGKQVAYMWFIGNEDNPHYELRLLQVGNPSPKVLYSCNKNESMVPEIWFSDGRKILVQKHTGKEKWQLASIDITSGEVSLIKEKTPGPSGLPILSLSPDEKQIAFDFPNLTEKGNYDIFIISIDTKNESPLIQHPANDRVIGPYMH